MHIKRSLIVSKADHERLEQLFAGNNADCFDRSSLRALRGELDRATVVAPEDVPPDVVTLDSTVRLCDSRSSYEDSYMLVHPEDAVIVDHHLSVLTPIGTAILGYRAGDNVCLLVPGGAARFRLKEVVFQPERDALVL